MQSVIAPYSHYFHINENGYQRNFFLTIYHFMYVELIENYKLFLESRNITVDDKSISNKSVGFF